MNKPQAIFNWPDTVKGATMKAMTFQVTVNGAAPSVALSAVSCKFAKDGSVTITPTVNITSAASWQFTVGPVAGATMAIAEGLHVGDIRTTDASGKIEKYAKVQIKILASPQ